MLFEVPRWFAILQVVMFVLTSNWSDCSFGTAVGSNHTEVLFRGNDTLGSIRGGSNDTQSYWNATEESDYDPAPLADLSFEDAIRSPFARGVVRLTINYTYIGDKYTWAKHLVFAVRPPPPPSHANVSFVSDGGNATVPVNDTSPALDADSVLPSAVGGGNVTEAGEGDGGFAADDLPPHLDLFGDDLVSHEGEHIPAMMGFDDEFVYDEDKRVRRLLASEEVEDVTEDTSEFQLVSPACACLTSLTCMSLFSLIEGLS